MSNGLRAVKSIKDIVKIPAVYEGHLVKQSIRRDAAIRLQKITREYFLRKQTEATKWVNNQKINSQYLLFKIAGKDINVPTNLSLYLVLK